MELSGPYFHTGDKATLRQVVDFYNRGGDFPNQFTDSAIRPLGLTETEKNALVSLLVAMTDDRVRFERAPDQHGAGAWCFPCGFVEWGEDVRAGAAREAREEARVEVTVGEVLQVTSNFHDPEKPTVGIWFAAELVDPQATPVAGDDAVAVGWFDPSEPPPLAFPTDATLLARLARGG